MIGAAADVIGLHHRVALVLTAIRTMARYTLVVVKAVLSRGMVDMSVQSVIQGERIHGTEDVHGVIIDISVQIVIDPHRHRVTVIVAPRLMFLSSILTHRASCILRRVVVVLGPSELAILRETPKAFLIAHPFRCCPPVVLPANLGVFQIAADADGHHRGIALSLIPAIPL